MVLNLLYGLACDIEEEAQKVTEKVTMSNVIFKDASWRKKDKHSTTV